MSTRYIFEREFEDETISIPRAYDEGDLNQAREFGYHKGYTEGVETTEEGLLSQIYATLLKVDLQIQAVFQGAQLAQQQLSEDCLTLARHIAMKIAIGEAQEKAVNQINEVLKETLSFLDKPTNLQLAVHPNLAEQMDALIKDTPGYHQLSWVIQGDESLEPLDCKLRWDRGEMERSMSIIKNKINEFLPKSLDKSEENESNT